MAKDPAFLFYPSDFLTGVSDLTFEERGQYITLLCLEHQKGRLSPKMISLCCGNATADVLDKFEIDEHGNYFNTRLEFEIEKRKEHSEKQRNRAIEGWKKRKENDSHDTTTADATALPLENRNENEIKDLNNTEIKDTKDEDKIDFKKLLEYFNSVTGKKIRSVSEKEKKAFNARIKEGYNKKDIMKAIFNCSKDEYHIENPKYLTLEFISRPDKFVKYLNAPPKADQSQLPLTTEEKIALVKEAGGRV